MTVGGCRRASEHGRALPGVSQMSLAHLAHGHIPSQCASTLVPWRRIASGPSTTRCMCCTYRLELSRPLLSFVDPARPHALGHQPRRPRVNRMAGSRGRMRFASKNALQLNEVFVAIGCSIAK